MPQHSRRTFWAQLTYWVCLCSVILLLSVTLSQDHAPPQKFSSQVNRLTVGMTFDFVSWEIRTLARKSAFGLLSPQRWLDEDARARFVLHFLDDIRESQRLTREIERIYSDPQIADPDRETADQQAELSALRARIERDALVAEAILGEQVSMVLTDGGFGLLDQLLPPVSGAFTPLPYILILSPRDRIERAYDQQLVAGLTAADQEHLEQTIMGMLPAYSAYTTAIGGLAAYPAMYLESSSLDWIADVIAHEWAHHYMAFFPLGWYYALSNETRTINETAATLIGEWAGQEVVLRFYMPLFQRSKRLPNALYRTEEEIAAELRFDFQTEMYLTRIEVDRLLAEGKIEEAERYMEERRRVFVANGYRLRRLNQAYFAFHGAYASAPGAAGQDPIGPEVRAFWAMSESPRSFLRRISAVTTLAALQALRAPS